MTPHNKLEKEINDKLIPCLNGDVKLKQFNSIYERVRIKDFLLNNKTTINKRKKSIYVEIIAQFLADNPQLLD